MGVKACSQAPLDGVTAAFYNAFFTSLPIGAFALFDRPVRRLGSLLAAPQAYNRKPPLTTRAFWKTGVLTAIVHASVRSLHENPSTLSMHGCKQCSNTCKEKHCARPILFCVLMAFAPMHRSEGNGQRCAPSCTCHSTPQGIALQAPF